PHPRRRTALQCPGRGVHGPGTVGRGRCGTPYHRAQHRGQGRGIAGTPARRDVAVFTSCDHRIAHREAANAREAEQLRRGPGRADRAVGRRRRPQHLRAQQRAGAARHEGPDRHHRRRGDRLGGVEPGNRNRPDGYHDAANGRIPDHGLDPAERVVQPAADHRAHRESDEGRPREMPGGRRLRLSGETRQYRTIASRHSHVASPLTGTSMMDHEQVNILLVDDQPAKLLAYEVILKELGENLVAVASGREALEFLLKNEVAVILVDVCMPELDGFELAAMIREHPRFQKTAMIFISAIQVSDIDRLRGYEMGAVDYVPVPVIPEVLRAKIRVFAELYRKTRQLERLNAELEDRVQARTAELEHSSAQLVESEQRRSMAMAAR